MSGADDIVKQALRLIMGGGDDAAESALRAFAETKFKTPQGKPMRLYHMTPEDIFEFRASPENRSGPAVFLSPYSDYQPAYHQSAERGPSGELTDKFKEGANVMPVYADVRNPLVLDHPRKIKEAAAKYQGGDPNFPRIISPEAKAAMEADGFDAIIFGGDNPIPYGDRPMDARLGHQEARDEEFIIFDPRKIKSATANRGTYDTSDPDITKALGGAIDDEDIDNALRLARAIGGRTGYAEAGSVPKGDMSRIYNLVSQLTPDEQPQPQPRISEQWNMLDPEQKVALAAEYPNLEREMEIERYHEMAAAKAAQPRDTRAMTHDPSIPRTEMKINMPLFGGEYSMGTAPYNVAEGLQGMAQGAYDFKTMPAYFFPPTAPFALAADVAESRLADDPVGLLANVLLTPAGGRLAKDISRPVVNKALSLTRGY